jgi:phosphoglycolate phosphatase
MRFRAFLFDLDGTLIDHFTAIHRCYVHTLAQFGRPAPTLAQVRAAVGGGLENALAKFFPAPERPAALRIYRAYWDRTMLDDVTLMPGARELLDRLHARGAGLAVITNKLGSSSRLICDHLGISPLLRAVVGDQDTPWMKPRPEFTAHVLEKLGAAAADSLLVGDSPYDVQAAHNGGVAAWCVTTGTHTAPELRAAQAEAVYPGLGELSLALFAPDP